MSLSLISLNTRGLRDIVKRKALFLFAKQLKTDLVFFSKSHILLLMTQNSGDHSGIMICGLFMVLRDLQG